MGEGDVAKSPEPTRLTGKNPVEETEEQGLIGREFGNAKRSRRRLEYQTPFVRGSFWAVLQQKRDGTEFVWNS